MAQNDHLRSARAALAVADRRHLTDLIAATRRRNRNGVERLGVALASIFPRRASSSSGPSARRAPVAAITEVTPATLELVRLARLLGVPLTELAYLEGLSPDQLRALTDDAHLTITGPDSGTMRRLAALTAFLPTPFLTTVAERLVDPWTAAQVLEHVDLRRVADYSRGLSVRYLADLAAHSDPAALATIVPRVAPEQICAVVAELAEDGDVVSLALVAVHLPPEAVARFLEVVEDDETVLRVAALIADDTVIDRAVACLSAARVARLVAPSADPDRSTTVAHLLGRLSTPQRARVDRLAGASAS